MSQVVLGLDVGQTRIGVAVGNDEVAIASPLTTLINDDANWEQLQRLVTEQQAVCIVVGLPRGLDGQETGQTRATLAFVDQLRGNIAVPIQLQDEAVTSVMAEDELQARGKPYAKGDIDALAAAYILQDYLDEQRKL